MKPFLLFFVLLNSFGGFCQQLSGLVLDSLTKKNLGNCKVYLATPLIDFNFEEALPDVQEKCYWYEGNYFLRLANTVTDSNGQYIFKNIKPGNYVVISEYDTPLRASISGNIKVDRKEITVKRMYLMVTCPYDITKDQVFCPKCKKINKVQPIFWGLPLYNENGKLIIKGKEIDISKYYQAGCSPDKWCNPSRHCYRCNLDF